MLPQSRLRTQSPGLPRPLCRRARLARAGPTSRRRHASRQRDPLAPKSPHHPAKAKAVICLFQHGGPSQMDLFDPKPELTKQNGKPHPDKLEVHFHTQQGKLLASPFKFAKRGTGRHRAVGTAAAHREDRGRHHAGALDDDRLRRSRGGPAGDSLRQDLRRAAGLGFVGALRPGHRAEGTAGLRRAVRSRRLAGGRDEQLVDRVPAGGLSGHAVPGHRHAGCAPRHARRCAGRTRAAISSIC